MKHCEEILRNMNWALLREQKAYCVNEMMNNKDAEEIYSGIVSLFDHLQEAAALDGVATEEEVFGANGDG